MSNVIEFKKKQIKIPPPTNTKKGIIFVGTTFKHLKDIRLEGYSFTGVLDQNVAHILCEIM